MIKGIHYIVFILLFGASSVKSYACPSLTMSADNVSCYGGFDGVASIGVSGPNGPFSIIWSQGALTGTLTPLNSGNTTTVSGLQAGVFSIYVTDQIGCTSIRVVTIDQPDAITASTSVLDVSCFGEATGIIDLTPAGGTTPYSYSWSNTSSNQNLSAVFSGDYSVVITDANSCNSSSIPATINQPAEAVQSSYISQHVSCAFGDDGYIDLSVWGGNAPYTFSWNSGTFLTEDGSNLMSGTYDVVITDSKGCQETNSILLTEPDMLSSTISGTDVLCNGEATGTVNLTPAGGSLPYGYTWVNSTLTLGNTEDLVNIPAEKYLVTITDDNGCIVKDSITIDEPALLISTIISDNVSCFGGSDGNIYLDVNGGIPAYSYSWTNSANSVGVSQNLLNITSETYSVVVTDENNCMTTNSVVISQPLAPLSLTYTKEDVLCNGFNTGSVDLTVVGGTPGYTYNWSNTSNLEDVMNLFAGNYSVTVQDINGCAESEFLEIFEPLAPLSISSIINDVLCFGDSTGSVNLTTTGGTQPYTYSWINSQFSMSTITEDLINFPAENYILTTTDANNCVLNDTFKINQPALLDGVLIPTEVLCYGELTGEIDLQIDGGVIPYSYSWSNLSIIEDLVNVGAGNYTVTVTDGYNCSFTDSTVIIQPLAPLSAFYNTDEPLCPGGNDGSVYYQVLGGTEPYAYDWSNGDNTPSIFNLTAGLYEITTTDAHNCVLFEAATLEEPDEIVLNEITTHLSCFESADGSINLSVTGGTGLYLFDWTNSTYELSFNDEDLLNYAADTYSITITDEHNCMHSESFILTEPDLLVVTPIEQNISCADAQDGGVQLEVEGGTPDYEFVWSNGELTQDISDLGPGIYAYTVTDDHDCIVNDSVELFAPLPIRFNEVITPVSCRDQMDGVIEVYPTGGYGVYEYLWSTNITDNEINELLGGSYIITVTDLVGCVKDTILVMPVMDIECLEVPNAFTPNNDGINDQWEIKNIYLYPEASVQIFNKWGKIVYEISNGYTDYWDGTKNGYELPAATYYYIIKIREDIHPYTGPITIVR